MRLTEFRHLNESDSSKLIRRLKSKLSGLSVVVLDMIDFYGYNAMSVRDMKELILEISSENLKTSNSFPHFRDDDKVLDFYEDNQEAVDEALRSINWFEDIPPVNSIRDYIILSTRTAISNSILEIKEMVIS